MQTASRQRAGKRSYMNSKSSGLEATEACNANPLSHHYLHIVSALLRASFFLGTNWKHGANGTFLDSTLPHRVSSGDFSFGFMYPVTRVKFAPVLNALYFIGAAPVVSIFRSGVPPFLGGGLPRLLATAFKTIPLFLVVALIGLEPLFAATTLLPETLFLHRASSPARSSFAGASKLKPSGYGAATPFLLG